MKLTTQAALSLYAALASMDGMLTSVVDGDTPRVINKPYNFSSLTRAVIARNLVKLQAVGEAYNKVRDKVILDISGGKQKIDEKSEQAMRQFLEIQRMLLEEVHDLQLMRLKVEDLKLGSEAGQNAIPGTTLSKLAPILEGDDWDTPEITFKTAA